MKNRFGKLLVAMMAAATVLSGCVVVDPHPYRDGPHRGDPDGDGVPNRYDARPGNPYRY